MNAPLTSTIQSNSNKYGLPPEVRFCKRCVISNQRPNSQVEYLHQSDSVKETIHFDAEGICDACRVAEAKQKTDWAERERELIEICGRFRKKHGYDCIVPGSGGKDSFYAAHVLKHRYGMHPLLITWAPHIFTEWGWNNLIRWQGVSDHQLYTPNRNVHRLLTRLALENLFHPFQPFIIGQKVLAVRVSAALGIPLIFYGENEAEYGNPKVLASKPLRDVSSWIVGSNICLSGMRLSELDSCYGLGRKELHAYLPLIADFKIDREVHYLGYYLKWHPQECYYYAVEHGGFEAAPERTPGTYSKYNSIDDKIDDLHYYTTYIKFGIGRATYDAAQEIRSGDITREEGVALVRRFDGEFPERFLEEVFRYLSVDHRSLPAMNRARFTDLAERFKSSHLWDGNQLRHVVT